MLGFDHLGVQPHRVTEGVPIDYLRHYRSGGYDFGTLAEDLTAGGGVATTRAHSRQQQH